MSDPPTLGVFETLNQIKYTFVIVNVCGKSATTALVNKYKLHINVSGKSATTTVQINTKINLCGKCATTVRQVKF